MLAEWKEQELLSVPRFQLPSPPAPSHTAAYGLGAALQLTTPRMGPAGGRDRGGSGPWVPVREAHSVLLGLASCLRFMRKGISIRAQLAGRWFLLKQ